MVLSRLNDRQVISRHLVDSILLEWKDNDAFNENHRFCLPVDACSKIKEGYYNEHVILRYNVTTGQWINYYPFNVVI
jgi:hypothetical protein